MIGLIQKDLCIIKSELRYFIVLLLVAFILRNDFIYAFCVIYASILPITALAYDEQAKWNRLADMLPFTTKQIVGSKYITGYLLIGVTALTLVLSRLMFSAPFENSSGDLLTLLTAVCAAPIVLALQLPFLFWIGVEKGRMIFILFVILTSALISLAGSLTEQIDLSHMNIIVTHLPLILLAAAIIISLLSFQASKTIYEHKKI